MHISDGLLPAQICLGGYAVTGLVTWYSLRQIHRQRDPSAEIPKAALLIAAFFVASSIRIPLPPSNVHLMLNGMLGTILGCYAFPAILIGLLLQALVFGHGGLTTLGINALMLGLPAILAFSLFQRRHQFSQWLGVAWSNRIFGFLAGAISVGLSTAIFYGLVMTMIPVGFDVAMERAAVTLLSIAHLPLMVIEGGFTALLVEFLQRVKPELLQQQG